MTAEDVLEMWDDPEGDIGELSSDEISDEELELDDPNKPITEGSDDELSALWVVEESEEEDEDYHSTRPSRNTPGPPGEIAVSPPPVLTAVTLPNTTQPDPSGPTPQADPCGSTPQADPCGPTPQPDPSGPTPQPEKWSSTLHPITIDPFTSPVGPTVPISASPLEVLELF